MYKFCCSFLFGFVSFFALVNSANAGAELEFIHRESGKFTAGSMEFAPWFGGVDRFLLPGIQIGDVDGNGSINFADVDAILFVLYSSDAEFFCIGTADVNQSGEVDITDALVLAQYLAAAESSSFGRVFGCF